MKISHNPKAPYRVHRFLQSGGERIRLIHLSSDLDGTGLTTIYAPAEPKPVNGKPKKNIHSQQAKRILAVFLKLPDEDISAIRLHGAGSGKPMGFVASLSRRISDLRQQGYNIVKSREERKEGQRHTFYRLIKNPDLEIYNSAMAL